MISMKSLYSGIHTILANKREGNVHPLLRRVNKITLGCKLQTEEIGNMILGPF
ncbi:hypothetical protein RHMOL_Rhmol05G0205100 [Rhododendron molle]|uniref:Uncharacterized protein n=1 Tax=Rhododendron molle TaxID=49168 RepID=A0ACC0NTC1_RHOML|nr:hypothetical protein RHMOL_Rhmol05G0205100 [Rhododendron molle]